MAEEHRLTGLHGHTRVADVSVFRDLVPDRPHLLRILTGGDGQVDTVRLDDGPSVIGRSEQAQIRIAADSLSRQHAVIERTRNGFKIQDLGSRNGLHVNEVRVHSAILRDGDTVRLGELVMRYFRGY